MNIFGWFIPVSTMGIIVRVIGYLVFLFVVIIEVEECNRGD